MNTLDYDDYIIAMQGQPHEGFVSEDEVKDLFKAKDWFEELVYHIYETGNIQEIEYAIEEIAAHMKVELPASLPKIQRRPSVIETITKFA